jgi:hypothetical protein
MAKTGISIGDDTPSGEPQNGPTGPYITDDDDGSAAAPRGDRRPPPDRHRQSDRGRSAAEPSGSASTADDKTPALPDELSKRPRGPAQPRS